VRRSFFNQRVSGNFRQLAKDRLLNFQFDFLSGQCPAGLKAQDIMHVPAALRFPADAHRRVHANDTPGSVSWSATSGRSTVGQPVTIHFLSIFHGCLHLFFCFPGLFGETSPGSVFLPGCSSKRRLLGFSGAFMPFSQVADPFYPNRQKESRIVK